MKKLIALILISLLVFSLFGCGEKASEGLQIGYGRVSIVPEYPVMLGGGSATRISEGCQDFLYLTCVAISKDAETFLLITMDIICGEDVFVDPTKAAISAATGIPESNILINGTHTHAGPSIRTSNSKNVKQYREDFYAWATEASQAAIADLSPAEVYYTSTQAEGMAWVRHYVMNDDTYSGSNFGRTGSGYKGHVVDADVEMQLIKFVRPANDKKDIVLMNFPAHATFTQNSTLLSADFPAPAREYVESETDTLVAYFIAAGGNQTPSSRIAGESFSKSYVEYGEALGRIAVEALATLEKAEGDQVRFSEQTFTAGYNKERLDKVQDAQTVKQIWATYGQDSTEGKAAMYEYGFTGKYEINAVIKRSTASETNSMQIRVMSIGNVGFILAPYEMFGAQGVYIKENAPTPMTFIITCSEGAEGYLPDAKGWEVGSYESHVSRYAPGTAEALAEEFVSMLTALQNET